MPERRAFCACGHSYWSHRTEFIARRLAHRCERQGCRCLDYAARPAPVVAPSGHDTEGGA